MTGREHLKLVEMSGFRDEPEVDTRFYYMSAWQDFKRARNDRAKNEAWLTIRHIALVAAEIPAWLHDEATVSIIEDPACERVCIEYGDSDQSNPNYGICEVLFEDYKFETVHWFIPENLHPVRLLINN